ncbi:unnamed protein product [Calicophoron daubneyi]|uniref:Uncharacterized protein n=1 Tax=Calicophoron daubneyi TaxID=300641 RepID=A0AAV2TKC2_CALDB
MAEELKKSPQDLELSMGMSSDFEHAVSTCCKTSFFRSNLEAPMFVSVPLFLANVLIDLEDTHRRFIYFPYISAINYVNPIPRKFDCRLPGAPGQRWKTPKAVLCVSRNS